jgi:nitroreductase
VSALVEPGPDAGQLDVLLRAATTVPDHGTLRPWRFVVISGDERDRFGGALASVALEHQADLPLAAVEKMRSKAFVAPTMVVIVASPTQGNKVPVWEQEASAACTGFALTLAAHALGLGAMWKSAPFRSGGDLSELLELTDEERILGWVNVGTAAPVVNERAAEIRAARDEVAPSDVASRLTDHGLEPVTPTDA